MVLFFAPRKHSSRCADETQRSRWSGCDAKNAVEHIRQLAREMLTGSEAFELSPSLPDLAPCETLANNLHKPATMASASVGRASS